MSYQILADGLLVNISKSLAGSKRSAIAKSKKEPKVIFTVVDINGKWVAKYRNGNEQWL